MSNLSDSGNLPLSAYFRTRNLEICNIRSFHLSSVLFKENLSYFPFTLPRKTCQGKTCQELASVYSQQVLLDKGTCQGKLAGVNEALSKEQDLNVWLRPFHSVLLFFFFFRYSKLYRHAS